MAFAQPRSLNPLPQIGFTVAFNMSEQPAATVNCGYDDEGLPIGLQIVGRRFDDLGVLAVARAFEEMRAGEAGPGPSRPNACEITGLQPSGRPWPGRSRRRQKRLIRNFCAHPGEPIAV